MDLDRSSGRNAERDRLEQLLKRLGRALHGAVADDEEVRECLEALRLEGWEGVMVLEASMACKRDEEAKARLHVHTSPTIAPKVLEADFRLNAADARLLATIGISPSRYRSRTSRSRRHGSRDSDR